MAMRSGGTPRARLSSTRRVATRASSAGSAARTIVLGPGGRAPVSMSPTASMPMPASCSRTMRWGSSARARPVAPTITRTALLLVQRGEQREVVRPEAAREVEHDHAHFVEHPIALAYGFDRQLDDVVIVGPLFGRSPVRPEQVDHFRGARAGGGEACELRCIERSELGERAERARRPSRDGLRHS